MQFSRALLNWDVINGNASIKKAFKWSYCVAFSFVSFVCIIFPHQFCRMHRLLSGIDSDVATRIFRRRKRCLWHCTATFTGHPIHQSTTYCTYVGGEVMVFVWGCSNHLEFSYLSQDIVFDNQPLMTQQYVLMWWQNWDSNIKPCKTVEDWGQLDHKKRWWCVVHL